MSDRPADEAYVAAAWNRNAERWSDDGRAGFDVYRDLFTFPAFLGFMPNIEGCQVQEIDCGEGTSTRQFASRSAHLTGVDLAEAMIARAKAEEQREPLGIRYQLGSCARLPMFEDNGFDHALSFMVFMDAPNLADIIRETHRLLKPGGALSFGILHPCFSTPNYEWLQADGGDYRGLVVGHYFSGTPWIDRWRFGANPNHETTALFEIPRFPRTLSDYVNILADAGFRIERLAEPRPNEKISAEHPSFQRWRDHAALVLFVRASKI
ncbi:MAG: methyltransferase domain-containing protein [Pseudomonadota bacterium]